MAQLINFKPYLEELISLFEKGDPARPSEPSLSSYYVDLIAEGGNSAGRTRLLNTYIKRWLRSEYWILTEQGKNHVAVLGEYGSGKSSFCLKVARDLASSYLEGDPASRIPILLNLRDFVGTIRMEAFISSFLDQQCRVVNPRFELFKSMNDFGLFLFLLIFDGLDEMAVKVDSDTLELNLLKLKNLLPLRKPKCSSPVGRSIS